MKDDQFTRQIRFIRPVTLVRAPLALPPGNQAAQPTPANPIRRLSWEEIQRRRAQNLCFNCNERFTAGHKCQGSRILMLEGCNDSDTLLCYNDLEEQLNQEKYEELTGPSIMLHALSGWTTPKTIRIAAMIGSCNVIILIDSGSTYNFISERTTNQLLLPVVPTETFTVQVANGESLKCWGRFEEVPVDL